MSSIENQIDRLEKSVFALCAVLKELSEKVNLLIDTQTKMIRRETQIHNGLSKINDNLEAYENIKKKR